MGRMPLADTPLRDLLAAFSSPDPTPGGGSASALAAAIGASLLMMVAGLPKTRSGDDDERTALSAAAAALDGIRARLTDAIDADAGAYDGVVAAYKLPKATADEQAARKAAIQQALRAATDVPLDVMRMSAAAIDQAKTVAANGHRAAASDVGVATALLRAGLRGAAMNIDINAGSVSDHGYVEGVRAESVRLSERAGRAADEAEALLRG
jgi:formiminotetrahydrofolate cyclodeaminase